MADGAKSAENNETIDQPTKTNNGEESFKDEIKDYAKSTMNELLGMFGYDDEITSESVNNLDIKVPSSGEPVNPVSNTVTATASTSSSIITPSISSIPINALDDMSDDVPVIVKVEGNTSVTDIIRKQNENSSNQTISAQVPIQSQPLTTVELPQTCQSTPVTMTTKPQTSQATLNSKEPITGYAKPQGTTPLNSPVTTPSSAIASPGLSMYLKSTEQAEPANCTWCRKHTLLKNFTFRDGTRILECRSICSQNCFEMAALSIDLNNDNIKSIQWRIRQLRHKDNPIIKQIVPPKPKPSVSTSTTKPSTVSTRTVKQPKTVVNKPLFDWEAYLKESKSKGAPASYFKQATVPPYNGFKPGMKLEVADPRVIQSTCLATVVGSIGPRIRISFDGTDKSNDVWHMVDSSDMHPVGWSEANNYPLQPPVGFTRDPGTYAKFIGQILSSTDMDKIAPPRLFKKDPETPRKNLFQTGMKLEAVDPKNLALVCVATVGDVDNDKIRIDFDGYLGSDYWCRFDSRNIFPVGWCAINGHALQPPGKKKRNVTQPTKIRKDEEPPAKKPKTPTQSPMSSKTTPTPTPTTTDPSMYGSLTVYINHGCKTGRYLNKNKLAKLKHKWSGGCVVLSQRIIQSLVNCALDQSVVFGFLKPGNGRVRITAKASDKDLACTLQHIDRVSSFWKVLDKFLENLRCCKSFVSAQDIKGVCTKCRGSVRKQRLNETDVSSNQVCSTSPAKTWSVQEVIKHIESTELSDHVSLFRIHEIDGRALLLLTRDMIMSYMGLKLGPAIKLLSIIDELKPVNVVD